MTDIPEATDGGIAAAAGAIERYCDNHGIPMPSPSTALLMATIAQPCIAAAERERIRSLLPYHVARCGNFAASVGDLINEREDSL